MILCRRRLYARCFVGLASLCPCDECIAALMHNTLSTPTIYSTYSRGDDSRVHGVPLQLYSSQYPVAMVAQPLCVYSINNDHPGNASTPSVEVQTASATLSLLFFSFELYNTIERSQLGAIVDLTGHISKFSSRE